MLEPVPALTTLGQVALPVRDIARAVAFYRDVLGMRFLFEAPPRLAFFDLSGVRLMLAEPETGEASAPGATLYYRVGDLERTVEALRARGAKVTSAPHKIASLADHDLWMAFVDDGEGNPVGLMAEVRR